MLLIIYNISYFFLFLLIVLLNLITKNEQYRFILKRFFTIKSLKKKIKKGSQALWIHAASIGETKIAIDFINQYHTINADQQFILTIARNTAFDQFKDAHLQHTKILPALLDFPFQIKHWLRLFQLQGLILVETELWPNTILITGKEHKIIIINARLSDQHYTKYVRFSKTYQRLFERIDAIFPRDQDNSKKITELIGSQEKILGIGNLKSVHLKRIDDKEQGHFLDHHGLTKDDFIFCAASIQPNETEVLIAAFLKLRAISDLKMVLIPRHIEKIEHFESIVDQHLTKQQKSQIIIIKQFGVLTKWYQVSQAIFVGGSYYQGRGGQNFLEAAYFEKYVAVGRYTENFQHETRLFQEHKAIKIIQSEKDLIDYIQEIQTNSKKIGEKQRKARSLVLENQKAMKETVERCHQFFS